MAGRRRKKRKQNGNGKIWISIIVATLLIVMSVQIVGLYNKKETYMAKQSSLKTQLEDEKNRSQEIKDYEEYTKTQKFIEDMAKSRLGLVYDNEVIFKKKQKSAGSRLLFCIQEIFQFPIQQKPFGQNRTAAERNCVADATRRRRRIL